MNSTKAAAAQAGRNPFHDLDAKTLAHRHRLIAVAPPDGTVSASFARERPEDATRFTKALGKVPADVVADGLRPLSGWQRHGALDTAGASRLAKAMSLNMGLVLGKHPALPNAQRLVMLDLDVRSPALQAAIFACVRETCGGMLFHRKGDPEKLGAVAVVVDVGNAAASLSKRKTIFGPQDSFEVLAEGQQVVIAGQHVSGNQYRWGSPQRSLPECPVSDLPVISLEQLEALLRSIAEAGTRLGFEPRTQGGSETGARGGVAELPALDRDDAQVLQKALRTARNDLPRETWVQMVKSYQAVCEAALGAEQVLDDLRDFDDRYLAKTEPGWEALEAVLAEGALPDRFGLRQLLDVLGQGLADDMSRTLGPELDGVWRSHTRKDLAGAQDVDAAVLDMVAKTASREPDWKATDAASLFDPWADYAAPLFPMDTLPDDVRQFVMATSSEMGACPSAVAMACLAVASGALTHEAKLELKPGFRVSGRLWVLLVGDVSSAKSPVISKVLAPLREAESAMRQHVGALAAFGCAGNPLDGEENGAPVPPPAPVAAPQGHSGKAKRAPPLKRYIINDATIEALAEALSVWKRGILVVSDEMSRWLGSLEQYTGSGGANRGAWLESFNGGAYSVARVSRDAAHVDNFSVSFLTGVQMDKLRTLKGLTDDGLLQRFLPVMMRGRGRDLDTQDAAAERGWDTVVNRLLQVGAFSTVSSVAALKAFRALADELHDVETNPTEGQSFRAWAGKLRGISGSIALLLHVLWGNVPGDPVNEDTARRVDRIVRDFLLPHGLLFDDMRLAGARNDAQAIGAFLARSTGRKVKVREIMRGVHCCRGLDAAEIGRRLLPFVTGNWLEPVNDRPWNAEWWINPNIETAFAKEAEAHRKAAEAIRGKIARLAKAKHRDDH